jgi:hypothetical protein
MCERSVKDASVGGVDAPPLHDDFVAEAVVVENLRSYCPAARFGSVAA